MIELKHLGKIYSSASGSVEALKDVNLTIADGEIFGIIGLSGAGKSTLVRCINLLERPTSGEVLVDGQNIMTLSQKELLQVRRQIGMIFQGFNLLEQRTVLRNICFPLEISGTPKAEAKKRAEELLRVVGLSDKAASYPRSSPAARSSAWRSPEPWRPILGICSATRRPARSTPTRRARSWSCCARSTRRSASPSSSLRTR